MTNWKKENEKEKERGKKNNKIDKVTQIPNTQDKRVKPPFTQNQTNFTRLKQLLKKLDSSIFTLFIQIKSLSH